jgi:hypothetical protein
VDAGWLTSKDLGGNLSEIKRVCLTRRWLFGASWWVGPEDSLFCNKEISKEVEIPANVTELEAVFYNKPRKNGFYVMLRRRPSGWACVTIHPTKPPTRRYKGYEVEIKADDWLTELLKELGVEEAWVELHY